MQLVKKESRLADKRAFLDILRKTCLLVCYKKKNKKPESNMKNI